MKSDWFERFLFLFSLATLLASVYSAAWCGFKAWTLYPSVVALSGPVTWQGVRVVWEYGLYSAGYLAFLYLIWSTGMTFWRVCKEMDK